MSVAVVTDSTADLPADVAAQHHIEVVPMTVLFGDEELRDGVDLTSERFFERLQQEQALPTTSQPSAGEFRQAYERLLASGATEILSIHVSGRLSGTVRSAEQGAADLDARVVCVDSHQASLALGMGVVRAAQAIEQGSTLDEARALAESHFERTHFYFVLESVEYLRRGGRIGAAQGFLGSLLKVRPVLTIEDGEVVGVARLRTRAKAIQDALDRIAGCKPIEELGVLQATTPDELAGVSARLRAIAPDAPFTTSTLGPAVGVHTGPGTLGMIAVSSPSPGG